MLSLFMVLSFPAYYDNEKHFRLFSCFFPVTGGGSCCKGKSGLWTLPLQQVPPVTFFLGKKAEGFCLTVVGINIYFLHISLW